MKVFAVAILRKNIAIIVMFILIVGAESSEEWKMKLINAVQLHNVSVRL